MPVNFSPVVHRSADAFVLACRIGLITFFEVRLDTSQHSLASPTCNGISINIDPADPEPTCISPKLCKNLHIIWIRFVYENPGKWSSVERCLFASPVLLGDSIMRN
ncbi:hypothetical protein ANCDUO_06152 [Ancylostoma duodenale]|uniref:Uncharacterized protein n=1 Tax=Ancylostoma duodenale TaxID=51022 RepID=A0A0C2D2G2_9BILA|nr:hypothetical protein ANCDUO_06152 [Ancylostoma duodenale]